MDWKDGQSHAEPSYVIGLTFIVRMLPTIFRPISAMQSGSGTKSVAAHSVCRKMLRHLGLYRFEGVVESLHLWREYLQDVFFEAGIEISTVCREKRIGFTRSGSVAVSREERSGISPARRCCTSAALPPRPMKAETSIRSVDSGRWKLVMSASTALIGVAGHDEDLRPAAAGCTMPSGVETVSSACVPKSCPRRQCARRFGAPC